MKGGPKHGTFTALVETTAYVGPSDSSEASTPLAAASGDRDSCPLSDNEVQLERFHHPKVDGHLRAPLRDRSRRLLQRRDRAQRDGPRRAAGPAERRGDPGHRPGRTRGDRQFLPGLRRPPDGDAAAAPDRHAGHEELVRLRTRGMARHRLPDRGHQPAALHLQPWPPDPGAHHRLHGRTERRPRPPARPDAAAGGCPAPASLT